MDMTPQRWNYTCDYLRDVFGRQDDHLAHLMDRAVEAGLPDIAVSSDVGRLMKMVTTTTRGRLALEIGTLGGYSGIWIARGLQPGGKLITIETEPKHAEFAQQQFEKAGVAERIDLRLGAALDLLPDIAREVGQASVDVVFADAIKTEYPDYWQAIRPLMAVGGFAMFDNVLGGGEWWIDDEANESRKAVDQLNRTVAEDDEFEAVAVPMRQGVLLARRVK